MTDDLDEMVVAVRADTGAFRSEIAALRGELEGSLGAGADAAGRAIERGSNSGASCSRSATLSRRSRSVSTTGPCGTSIAMALFGAPGRATGGPVSAGRAYRVGERGPEWFVPTASGRVEAAGGAVRNIAITVNVRGEAGSDPQRLAQTGRQMARAVRRAVAAGDD